MENEATTTEFEQMLAARGVSRRSFLKLCGAIAAAAAAAGTAQLTVPQVAEALEASVIGAKEGALYPVIWIEGASCTGCTEAFAQIEEPDPATVVLEMISLNYNETLSAAAGWSMETAKEQTIEAGNYLLVYEGAILEGWNGQALRVADTPGTEILVEAAKNANAVVAVGSCAVNGGWMAAYPNPSNATGVQAYLEKAGIDTPVVNIPGCPANPEWLVSALVDVVMLQQIPTLNDKGMPALAFDETIHANCERRGHFENGEFVYRFGSEEEKQGYCLYPVGCRGPQTKANCGVVRYNNRRSWCVASGSPCIGCCEANPADPGDNWVEVNTPFYKRMRDLRLWGPVQPEAIAWGVTGIVAAAVVIHAFGIKASGRMKGEGAPMEQKRAYDIKNPDSAVGNYNHPLTIIKADGTVVEEPQEAEAPEAAEASEEGGQE